MTVLLCRTAFSLLFSMDRIEKHGFLGIIYSKFSAQKTNRRGKAHFVTCNNEPKGHVQCVCRIAPRVLAQRVICDVVTAVGNDVNSSTNTIIVP